MPKIETEENKPKIPQDVFEASVMSQRGELVDMISFGAIEEDKYFYKKVQEFLNWIAKTINSLEYKEFELEISELLKDVKGQNFVFDIEGVVMSDMENFDSKSSERVYYVIPWTQPVLNKLIKNGNNVMFWTSATEDSLEKMKKGMRPELANLSAISRNDWEKIALAYASRSRKKMTDEQVLEAMQSVYPSATLDNFQAGLNIFNKDTIKSFKANPLYFLRFNKYPQIFADAKNSFFIDDNDIFIESATRKGWPEDRAIKINYFPEKDNVADVARSIRDGMER